MNYSWRHTVIPIATIFSFRLLGLFMLIPIFTLFTHELSHATPLLIGIALGSYGLSQGILQIPFGMLSDRFGRKPIITLGLVLFAIGSMMGAWAHSIELMISARILQGAGAIGSVLMALLADLTPDEQRTKAMAVVGISIGMSFSIAMIISPILSAATGLAGIFYFTAVLAVIALCLLHLVIPTPARDPFHERDVIQLRQFKFVLQNKHLLRLNAGIFIQHLILTSTFYALPLLLKQHILQQHLSESWHFYLPLMLSAFIIMVPIIVLGERQQRMKFIFILAVVLTTLNQCALFLFNQSWLGLCVTMLIYFVAFNILEATLPSQVSRQAGTANKGTAMGIYSSCQFLGIFAGGALAGVLFQYAGSSSIFLLNAVIGFVWIGLASFMRPNEYQLTRKIPFGHLVMDKDVLQNQLRQLKGIHEISISLSEKTIFLLLSKHLYIEGSAESIIQGAQKIKQL
jgi:MFS family permease